MAEESQRRPGAETPPRPPDARAWELLVELAALSRPPGSAGEGRAAELIADELTACGARARIERESVHGTYWIPIGLACAAAAAASAAGSLGAIVALVACAAVVDDLSIGRRPLRRVLGRRVASNVIGEYGPAAGAPGPAAGAPGPAAGAPLPAAGAPLPADGAPMPADGPTLVIHAHHDAAHTGLVFHPAGAKLAARLAGGLMERAGGTPAPMWGAPAGPAAIAAGRLLGRPRLRRLGAALAAGYAAAMLDIWARDPVPGANDNLSGVCALLAIARGLEQAPPQRLRVILLSTGAEESFLEAMVAFGKRHFPRLPPERTTFLCLESVGSPQLMLLSGEGLLRRRRYPPELVDTLTQIAARTDIPLRDPFAYRLATDGQVPLRAGYPTAVISSMDWYKAPSNYHWPSDRPGNLTAANVWNAARLALALIAERDADLSVVPAP